MDVVSTLGVMALASMFVPILPLALGIVYAVWPTEQRLTLMRPLSLATVCSAVAGVTVGLIYELRFISRADEVVFSPQVAFGLAESLVPLFFGLGCLTIAWLCVTIGLSRLPAVRDSA